MGTFTVPLQAVDPLGLGVEGFYGDPRGNRKRDLQLSEHQSRLQRWAHLGE